VDVVLEILSLLKRKKIGEDINSPLLAVAFRGVESDTKYISG
jgi:hypothetical protein